MTIHQLSDMKQAEQVLLQVMENETGSKRKKRYKINEIFYSIQGEGILVGSAAIFIRFSACNLSCSWCDTEYDSGVKMSMEAILAVCERLTSSRPLIVCTGGEPSLQMDEAFVDALRGGGYQKLSMETNGIKWNSGMEKLDIVTVSPKTIDGWWGDVTRHSPVKPEWEWRYQHMVLKVVYDPSNPDLTEIIEKALRIPAKAHFLQPLEDQETGETNVKRTIRQVQSNPRWRLSLQTHKVLGLQ